MDASTIPDKQLVQRALAGDADAIELIVHRHIGAVRAYAGTFFGNDAVGEEVAQDTFVKASRRLATFRHESSLQRWLLRICERCCIDRERRREPTTVDLGDGALDSRGDAKPTLSIVSAQWHADEQRKTGLRVELWEKINALPVCQRQAVYLVLIRGYSRHQAAVILGIPPSTMRDRLIRARLHLVEELGHCRRWRREEE